jgi:Na+-driven multidrug efflux pump
MKHNKEMKNTNIPKLLVKFSLPAIVALLVNALYNIVDSIFVGKGVGDLALAGVSVSFPIVTTTISFVMLIAMGATVLISLYLGKQKKQEAEKILGNALVLLIIISILITTLGLIFVEDIVKLFGATDNVFPYAVDYMRIIFAGTIFLAISTGVNAFIRAEGNPKTAMATMLIGAITNILLDYIFIYVFG